MAEVAINLWLMQSINIADQRVDRWCKSQLNSEITESSSKNFTAQDIALQVEYKAAADEARQKVRLLLLGDIALNIVISLILAIFFSKAFSAGMSHLRENASLLAARKPLQAPLKGNGEIEDLDRVFHTIALELTSAEQRKQDFVAMISNDMRTPLSALQGTLALFASGTYGALSDRGINRVVASEANIFSLINLINQMLEMEKIVSGTLELHIRDFAVASAIQQSIESVRVIAEQASVTMENHCTDEPIHVCGDEQKTTQILIGLVASILKTSVPGKTVSLVSKKLEQFAEIEVVDAGSAIPSSLAREIVDQSPRFERSFGKNASTGLSLALCKALVEAQGGNFSFTSTADSGNVFSFRLPLARSKNSSVS